MLYLEAADLYRHQIRTKHMTVHNHRNGKYPPNNTIRQIGRILFPRRLLRQPTPVFSWIFGILLLLDIPVMLIMGLTTLTLAEESAPDATPECLFSNLCPATPQQRLRDNVILYGSLALWFLFVLVIHLAVITLMDDALSSKHRQITICIIILFVSLILLRGEYLLNQWVHNAYIVAAYYASILIAALWPAYVSARIRCHPYAHKGTS